MNTRPSTRSGLVAWLENTRISLPLKGVEARFEVRGDLVSVRLRQVYHQNHSAPLHVRYTFPLPGGASVHQCTFMVNDRVISAKVLRLEEARALARQKKDDGYRTALVESLRGNLFELGLGNLAPGDTVVVELEWFQVMESSGQERSFRIPFTPGVRYIPGAPLLRRNAGRGTEDDTDEVPDASRLSPPRVDAFHPDAAWASVEGRIAADGVPVDAASPSHTLVLRESAEGMDIRLGDKAAVPDRDFVLRIHPRPGEILSRRAWITRNEGHSHALVRICAPAQCPARSTATDVYFMVDRSGSMDGDKWTACCRAFRRFLAILPAHDRAWVTFFETSHCDLAEKPLPPAAILEEPAVQALEELGVDGGTELLPAMQHVLAAVKRFSTGRRAVIVLITDGQVGNEGAVLKLMAQHPALPVYCFGIDHAVNDAFLHRLAAAQRGECSLVTPQEDLEGAIERLASRLLHPVLTGIEPPVGWELATGAIPDLHAGEMLTLCLRGEGSPAELAFTADAGDSGGRITLNVPAEEVTDSAPARLWARERITQLEAIGQPEEATALSMASGIICRYTAFFAWDGTEIISCPAPIQELYQPSQEVRGFFEAKARYQACCMSVHDPDDLLDDFGPEAPMRPGILEARPSMHSHSGPLELPAFLTESHEPGGFQELDNASPASGSAPILSSAGRVEWRELRRLLSAHGVPPRVIDWLEQWSLSVPALTNARIQSLFQLAVELHNVPNPANRIAVWIKQNVEPEFFKAMRHALDAEGQTLTGQESSPDAAKGAAPPPDSSTPPA